MAAWVYVMESDRLWCRVGFHTTTDKQRLREVSNGQKITWRMHQQPLPCPDELSARAVEALAHARLGAHHKLQITAKMNKKGQPIRAWGFQCTAAEARRAVIWAHKVALSALK